MNQISTHCVIPSCLMSEDRQILQEMNRKFIQCVGAADCSGLNDILALDFQYMDGGTGEVMGRAQYDQLIPVPGRYRSLEFDQLEIRGLGPDIALVAARTHAIRKINDEWKEGYARYLDVYQKREAGWVCTFACVWHL